ncbi:hypothetical protein [Actinomadura atramentaria]|uniref:hypothetical protein n=1 Tax=Actinomadura atramentaria TaxID=1990 RepID=UPI0012FC42E6|nr:hypothetical protein [Actinomadura atramentaria]
MTRYRFGGGIADYVVSRGDSGELTLAGNVPVTFWSAESGGAQYTDLLDRTGTPIPDGVVSSSATGAIPAFGTGPDGVRAMWASASPTGDGQRCLITTTDLGETAGDLEDRIAVLESRLTGVGRLTAGPVEPEGSAVGDVWFDTSAPTGGNPVTYRASGGAAVRSASLVCPLPVGIEPGDYLIALMVYSSTSGETMTAQPDWAQLVPTQQFGGDTTATVYGKVYAAGDAALSWTLSVPVGATAAIVAYANAAADVVVGPAAARTTTTSVTDAPSLTTTEPDALVACLYAVKNSGTPAATDPVGTVRRIFQAGAGTSAVPSALVCDFSQPVPGPTGQRSAVIGPDSNNGLGVQIALRRRA